MSNRNHVKERQFHIDEISGYSTQMEEEKRWQHWNKVRELEKTGLE